MSRRFDPLVYRDPIPSRWLIHTLSPVVRHVVLPRVLRIRDVEIPAADLARLRDVLGSGKAAFLGPNHPEFMTDWMIDKEISRRISPLMAHWASYEVVNASSIAQEMWLRNNLISNAPGGTGRAYSVRWALAGHGVLLHPEGAPSGDCDAVGPLVPGIVEMAWETCRSAPGTPVFIVPLVWKLRFTRDVGRELLDEIARIEKALGFRSAGTVDVADRFAMLHRGILARSRERFGTQNGSPHTGDFFTDLAAHRSALLGELEARYGNTEGPLLRRIHALRRAILSAAAGGDESAREDRQTLREVERLSRFSDALARSETLTQEVIASSLKQTRLAFLTRGWRNVLHGAVPVAVAERIAHVRAPDPIAVHEVFARNGDETAARDRLLGELRARLQVALDGLNAEIAPQVDPFRRPNRLLVRTNIRY